MPTIELAQGLQLLRDTCRAAALGLEGRHPKWDANSDARLAFSRRCRPRFD